MIQSDSTNQLLLPPEQFYWALLDGSVIQGRSALPQQLGYLLEAVLPVPIEQMQAVYARIDIPDIGMRYLACGMQRDRLESLLTASSSQDRLATLGPERLPEFLIRQIGTDQLEELGPGSLNLLQGQYEPRPIRKLRRRGSCTLG